MNGLVFLLSILLVLGGTFFAFKRKKEKLVEKQSIGLEWLKALRLILANVQKHRGQSTAFLRGDPEAKDIAKIIQIEIDFQIEKTKKISGANDNERWILINEHWRRLEKNYASLSVANNLEQHGKLIKSILFLVEDLAEENQLLRLEAFGSCGRDAVWKDLLSTAEYMGQARACGVGVIASGECGSVERIRINYLHEKIKSTTNNLFVDIPQLEASKKPIDRFVSFLETDVFQTPPVVTPKIYFDIATRAIDSLYDQFDAIVGKAARSCD